MVPLNRRRFIKAASAGVGTLAFGPDRLFAGQRCPDRVLPAGYV